VAIPVDTDSRLKQHRADLPTSLAGHLLTVTSARVFIVLWGGLVVVDLAQALAAPTAVIGVLLVVLTGLCSLRLARPRTIGGALVAWLVLNGFVEGSLGQLGWHGWTDVWWLLALVVVALVAGGRR